MIRLAAPDDAAALHAIYARYIDTPVTFECTPPTVDEFRERVVETLKEYPWLVYEAGGRLVGYAYAHRHMAREAYQWNAELSVYLDRSVQSLGIGTALYTTLIELLRLQGVRNVFGCVTLPNQKSERLHESLGFHRAGVFYNAGYKCESWRDICWFQKNIAPFDAPPNPFIGLREADQDAVTEILSRR